MKKILIAGCGHGGLCAAAKLAEAGYDVTIYESRKREELGYDWHDTIDNDTFDLIGIKRNPEDMHLRKDNTFFGPNGKTAVHIEAPPPELIQYDIDRKLLYKLLIDNATDKGVKILFENKVNKPLIEKGKVIGLIVGGEKILGDMVIDSAGMRSQVRDGLPESYGIDKTFKEGEVFHTYRAYFDMDTTKEILYEDRFSVYFMFEGVKGIVWFKTQDDMADILVGSVYPLTIKQVEEIIEQMRIKVQPCIGRKVIRGGMIADIPLRATFSKIIGDNYAAVGDVVSMPLPINGSGISSSIRGGKILAETIIDIDKNKLDYSINNLWTYQAKYFKMVGANMISIAVIKNCILDFSIATLNYFFDKGVLGAAELGAGATGQEIVLDNKAVLDKVKRGWKKLFSLLKIKSATIDSKKAKELALSIPEKYDKEAVENWMTAYKKYQL